MLYLLEGKIHITFGDKVFNCEPGGFSSVSKDTVLYYATDSRASALFVVAPEGAVEWSTFGFE